MILLGVVLVAVCATGTVAIYRGGDTTVAAVGVAAKVPYGERITEGALRVVQVHPDPGVRPVQWDRRTELVGQVAMTDLLPGSLVTAETVTGEQTFVSGKQLVGVAVKVSQLPATALQPRDSVVLVPSGQGSGQAELWTAVKGLVLRVGERDPSGVRVVDVVVPEAEGPQLATRASAGQVAIVLLPRSR